MKPMVVLVALIALAVASARAQTPLLPSGQYPVAALDQGLGGIVDLNCTVLEAGRADCVIMSEMPGGMGFGEAALEMSRAWSLTTGASEDSLALGMEFQRTVRFIPGPEPSVRTMAGCVDLPWEHRPSANDFADHLPDRVFEHRIDGGAVLDCIVNARRGLDCEVVDEDPPEQGFGRAALLMAEEFRIAPQMPTGEDTIGGHVRIPIRLNVR
jgi:TonB family protein